MVNPSEKPRQGSISGFYIDNLFGRIGARLELVLQHDASEKMSQETWHIDVNLPLLLELREKIDQALDRELRSLEVMCEHYRSEPAIIAYEKASADIR